MLDEPGIGAATEEQRGTTMVREGAPEGSATATAPGTEISDVAFCSVTTVFGEHGGTTPPRWRSPAGRITAREPSVLNGFGFSFLLAIPTAANTRIITAPMISGSRTLPGGSAGDPASPASSSLSSANADA